MRYWYSNNAKIGFRPHLSYDGSGSSYYGILSGDHKFKTTAGNEYAKMGDKFPTISSSSSASSLARMLANILTTPFGGQNITKVHVCLDETTFDDTKYNYNGEVAGITKAFTSSFDGTNPCTILTLTNNSGSAVTFNAVEFVTSSYFGDTTLGNNTEDILIGAVLLDESVTLASGEVYTITYAV